MGPLEREAARRRAQRKLDAMRRRTRQLRHRVVAAALVAFVALWAVVFIRMATGHDPALGGASVATVRSAERESVALDPERRRPRAALPPAGDEGDEEDEGGGEGPGALEPAAGQVERIEAERVEAELREAEARELEELEAVTTGQS